MNTQTDTATAIAGVGDGYVFTGHEEPATAARRGKDLAISPLRLNSCTNIGAGLRSDHARHPDRANTYLLTC
jgi:hypothetical protein